MITIKNPHSILAALENRPKDVQAIVLPKKSQNEIWDRITVLARQYGISCNHEKSTKKSDFRGAISEARVKPIEPKSLQEVFESDESQGLWLALDTVQDPQNLGALFRIASFFGVKGILMSKDRSSNLTSVVYDVASGGVESVPYCIESNFKRAIDEIKEDGFWTLGSSEHASLSYAEIKPDRKWVLVLGNEESGMRRLTEESCDQTCTIPNHGAVTSLNVAVAGSILISHLSLK